MPPQDQPGPMRDALGRYRSPVTFPGYRKGKPPTNKGRKLPAEVLTLREIDDLLNAAGDRPTLEKRERAMVWLMYRVGLRAGQLVALERWHYKAESGQLTIPGGSRWEDRVITLDSISREMLADWLEARRKLHPGRLAPLFCAVLENSKGQPMRTATIRQMLTSRAQRAGLIDRRVTPEGLRKSGMEHSAGRAMTVEGRIEAYIDEVIFRARYAEAFEKWKDAHDLYVLGAERHATRIGHDCREAMMLFAGKLAELHGVHVDAPAPRTIIRVGAVLERYAERLGESATAFVDALVGYWRAVSALAQRQEHGAAREKEPLDVEDARRLVFQTMLVMYEVDRAVSRFA